MAGQPDAMIAWSSRPAIIPLLKRRPSTMQRMSAMRARNLRNGLLFASPWLLGFLIFVLYPLLASLYYSFTDYNIIKPPQWVGLENVRALLTDSLFWTSMGNTLYMVVFGLPASLAVSLLLAILLNQRVAGMPLFRTIFYL